MKLPSIVTMSLMGVVSEISGKRSNSGQKKTQTPEKRMKQLNRFSQEWLRQHIETTSSDPGKRELRLRKHHFDRFSRNISEKTKMMLKVYNLENDKGERRCGYFDPLTTHGGPQLEKPDIAAGKQEKRKEHLESMKSEDKREARHLIEQELNIDSESLRREDIHERRIIAKLEDLSHIREQLLELEDWFAANVDENLDLDHFLGSMDEYDRHRRASDNKKTQPRYDQNDPIKGWKQITTGYRKWAQRYIAYCSAEYIEHKFSKWAVEKLFHGGKASYQRILDVVEA